MSGSGRHPTELGAFLQARRAELSPEQVGLPAASGSRRVPGLRREEVAQLAMISTDYYTRLEQGRLAGASAGVLDALADALRLGSDQRSYLYKLTNKKLTRRTAPTERVWPQTQLLLDNLVSTPAMVLGRCFDVLAWNPLAAAVFIDFGEVPRRHRNYLRLLFLDPEFRSRYDDWHSLARTSVAFFRMAVVERPADPRLIQLIGDLSVHDADFRTWWAERNVDYQTFGTKSLRHPLAGAFTLDWQLLRSAHDDGQTILIMTAPSDTRSQEALRFLAAWTEPSSTTPANSGAAEALARAFDDPE
ncbi:MAG TPA: helix-turn-helix transcriptional regulator [Kribbella sp.]|uniref:helix-turn-helix transcriptional regulator n=1 Tax=Kribbella sp. TaxID=1871183 RepID=UPI002D76D57A|nr:helix-turn-helix transcriptional regulator [Kribbella sp.]HET6291974.1 helix-turn-helix transcriptional regulator [Kribbella sp.]